MSNYDYTSMGGEGGKFLTTHWSLIEDIKEHQDNDHALIGLLMERYWKPVYCYLRRNGYDNEQAKDLTQGFFQEVVLTGNLIQSANQTRGRFRTFLLAALEQYIKRVHRKETSRKRIPNDKICHLEQIDPAELPEPVDGLTAEQSFNYAWVSDLLDQMLEEVQATYCSQGKAVYWLLFADRILQPIMDNTSAPSLDEICEKYGVENTAKASNMIITVKRRFRATLRRYLRQAVASNTEVEEELKELIRIFS